MPRLTIDEFRALAGKISSLTGKKNKYNAKRSDGHASTKEGRRARELYLLQKAGKISNLREQVRYLLFPARRNSVGYLERAIHYTADFVYIDSEGNTIVEDTKGVRTEAYILRRKLMLHIHDITIHET